MDWTAKFVVAAVTVSIFAVSYARADQPEWPGNLLTEQVLVAQADGAAQPDALPGDEGAGAMDPGGAMTQPTTQPFGVGTFDWGSGAPIGVRGAQPFSAGQILGSYRFTITRLQGLRDGDNRIGHAEALAVFLGVSTARTDERHELEVGYAVTDDVAVLVMIPWMHKSWELIRSDGVKATLNHEGIGDIEVTALVDVIESGNHTLRFNGGISLPTGSVDGQGSYPLPTGRDFLAYAMQLGSGTVDLKPGGTWIYHDGQWTFGGQVVGTIRLGQNDNGYSFGDRIDATAWAQYAWCRWMSSSVRLDGHAWGNVNGGEPALSTANVPAGQQNRTGGSRVDLLFGLVLHVPDGPLAYNEIAIEGGMPVYQYLDGPQLETDWIINVGWRGWF